MGDAYIILNKNADGSYSVVRLVDGREQAQERIRLLNSKRPGTYLLLNVETKMIEDENADAERPQE